MSLIRSGAISGYESLVSKLGGNPIALLAAHDLSHSQLSDPNTYISYSAVASLLEHSAQSCDEPLFGLLLSQHHHPTVIGELYFSLVQWNTLREVLEALDKYLYLHANGAHLTQVPRGKNVVLELNINTGGTKEDEISQLMQMSVGQLNNFIIESLGLKNPAFPIHLSQPAPQSAPRQQLREICKRIKFDAAENGLCIPADWLDRKPHYDEADIRRHFQDYLKTLQQHYPGDLNMTDQIKVIIRQLLPNGECSLKRVAATLEMHPRALQKALQEQGLSYHALLQQTRLQIAIQHLKQHSLSISELALNLGFAEVSVFSRSFRKWTGMSPKSWQKRHDQDSSLKSERSRP